MDLLTLFAVFAATPTFTYDADVLPNQARPPWSFRETSNCSAAVEGGVLHVRDDGTARGELQFISFPWAAIARLVGWPPPSGASVPICTSPTASTRASPPRFMFSITTRAAARSVFSSMSAAVGSKR